MVSLPFNSEVELASEHCGRNSGGGSESGNLCLTKTLPTKPSISTPEAIDLFHEYFNLNLSALNLVTQCWISIASSQWLLTKINGFICMCCVKWSHWKFETKHPTRRALNSAWTINTLCDGFLGESSLITLKTENSGWTWQKSSDNHYKN